MTMDKLTIILVALFSFLMGMISLVGIFLLLGRTAPYALSQCLKQIHPRLAVELAYWKEQSILSSTKARLYSDTCLDAFSSLAGLGLAFHYHGDTIRWKRKADKLDDLDLYAPWRDYYFNQLGSILRHINPKTLGQDKTKDSGLQTPLDKWAERKDYVHEHIQNLEQTLPGISAHSLIDLFRIVHLLLSKFEEADFAEFLERDLGLHLIPYTTIYPESEVASQTLSV